MTSSQKILPQQLRCTISRNYKKFMNLYLVQLLKQKYREIAHQHCTAVCGNIWSKNFVKSDFN